MFNKRCFDCIHGASAATDLFGFVNGEVHYTDGNRDERIGPEQEFHPVCIREKVNVCDVGDFAAEACWDSGPEENARGLDFVLHSMAADTFSSGAGGVLKCKQICEAAGLHTFCPLRNYSPWGESIARYVHFRGTYGCLPGGVNDNVWGDWGGGGDSSADAIPQMIGWDAWLIHDASAATDLFGFVNGEVHYTDGNRDERIGLEQEFHPVCIREKWG